MAASSANSRPTPFQVKIFISYAHEDEGLKDELLRHLSLLKRQGIISEWHDRRIVPSDNWSQEIDSHLESAQIVLLLISADFLASDYCYERELKRALERHKQGATRVVPVFLRPVDWKGALFEHLQGLPLDARPITNWSNRDDAWVSVAKGIRIIAESFQPSETGSEMRVIVDPEDDDLLRTLLVLYPKIPESERFPVSDIIRWIREDLEEDPYRKETGSRNHFVIAKSGGQVCGFLLAHSYRRFRMVFLAYLVAEKGASLDGVAVSQKLVDYVFGLSNADQKLSEYNFMLEVDDPVLADKHKERRKRCAQIELFSALAQRRGRELRALDFDYRQPHLTIPKNTESGQGLPMLLMFAGQSGTQEGWLEKQEVAGLLDFICNWLYPNGFSDVPEENEQYRAYTRELCRLQIANLPDRVHALSTGEILKRNTRTEAVLDQEQLDAWRKGKKALSRGAEC